mmetsp:Transcript_113453/g.315937  ORF Transcript_113453/g.315937 Transcript_113453/m.315937 type:complete len:290 (+) Transcript_113453:359-1228(+)
MSSPLTRKRLPLPLLRQAPCTSHAHFSSRRWARPSGPAVVAGGSRAVRGSRAATPAATDDTFPPEGVTSLDAPGEHGSFLSLFTATRSRPPKRLASSSCNCNMSASSSSKARRSPSSQTASSASMVCSHGAVCSGAPVSAGVPRSDSGYLLGSVVSKRALSFVSVPRPLVGVSLARPAASSPDDARAPRGGDTRPPLVRRSKASRPPTGALSPCAASPGRVPPRDLGPGSAKDLVTQAATAVTAASMSAPAREPLPFRDNGGRSVPLPAAPLFRGDNVELSTAPPRLLL